MFKVGDKVRFNSNFVSKNNTYTTNGTNEMLLATTFKDVPNVFIISAIHRYSDVEKVSLLGYDNHNFYSERFEPILKMKLKRKA